MRAWRAEAYRKLYANIEDAIKNSKQRKALKSATDRFWVAREAAYHGIEDAHQLRERARSVKRRSIVHLDDLLDALHKNVEGRGGKVYKASSPSDALRYILDLAKEKGVKLAVKSKSMTTEEIELNRALEENGVSVVDTDLGERIIQLAGEKPSHIIAPAIHKDRHQIAELFSKSLGRPVPPEPEAITKEARASLREAFLSAQMGITGANIAIAESGSIVLVTNEGNARLVTSLPPIHVAVMGMEKVVETVEDAIDIIKVLPRSATGQKLTTYISFLAPPGRYPSGQRREFHLIILDNGRSKMRDDPIFVDALNCLRCGACLNVCPTYKVVGGHVFGHVYTGAIGIPWTAFTHSWEKAASIAPLCIACGLCESACPVAIDIPKMIMHVKEWDNKHNGQPRANRFIAKLESFSMLASSTAPLSNWLLRKRFVRRLMEWFTGIDRRRPIPLYRRETLVKWFRTHNSKGRLKAVYFMDVYANYNDPELGRSVVEVLELNDTEVVLPRQRHSGMPFLSYGMLDEAEEIIRFNIRSLADYVRKGYYVVASEPTAAFALKHLYPTFLDNEEARMIASSSYELFEYLSMLRSKGLLNTNFSKLTPMKVAYHTPCHTKSMLPNRPVMELMELIGLEVRPVEVSCCGIAGTFGYKKGITGFDLSMEIGRPLFEEMSKDQAEVPITESSVCMIQIQSGTGRRAIHPVTLLLAAYRGDSLSRIASG